MKSATKSPSKRLMMVRIIYQSSDNLSLVCARKRKPEVRNMHIRFSFIIETISGLNDLLQRCGCIEVLVAVHSSVQFKSYGCFLAVWCRRIWAWCTAMSRPKASVRSQSTATARRLLPDSSLLKYTPRQNAKAADPVKLRYS